MKERASAKRAAQSETARLRPITMTVASTLLGVAPLVLAGGAGAESRIAIELVILSGLAFSSLLIGFATPMLYEPLALLTSRKGKASHDLDEALDKNNAA